MKYWLLSLLLFLHSSAYVCAMAFSSSEIRVYPGTKGRSRHYIGEGIFPLPKQPIARQSIHPWVKWIVVLGFVGIATSAIVYYVNGKNGKRNKRLIKDRCHGQAKTDSSYQQP